MIGTWQFCRRYLVYILLVIATIAVYWQVSGFNFINYDDSVYVYDNPHILEGLTTSNIFWAFTTFRAANWHPLTWMSLVVDGQVSHIITSDPQEPDNRFNPAVFHITNLVLHIANVLILFTLLKLMTGSVKRSALVALVFAIHPLHVESVAWIAERKDVLSTLFMLLGLLAYIQYVKASSVLHYWLMLLAFTLGLLAKPMLVSFPFLLILLDYWPLHRFRKTTFPNLFREKLPLIALASFSCVMTVLAQRSHGAVMALKTYSVGVRIANAIVAYIGYIGKTILPVKLGIFYPHPGSSIPIIHVIICGLALITITIVAVLLRKRYPSIIVGWLWYIITLLPVIGLVQVGTQAMADRYSYITMIGLLIGFMWSIPDIVNWKRRSIVWVTGASVCLIWLMFLCYFQVGYWYDGESLFRHTLAVTSQNNAIAHYSLGVSLSRKELDKDAVVEYLEALRVEPRYADARFNLANVLARHGKLKEAIVQYSILLKDYPKYYRAHVNVGITLARQMQLDKAIYHLRQALRLAPGNEDALYNLKQLELIQKNMKLNGTNTLQPPTSSFGSP